MRSEDLRKSILQQAIQGKLVNQNPADEPASVLLERIRAEKDRLVQEGKIKKDKNPSHIFKGDDGRYYEKIGKAAPVDITDELPFEIPENWTWVRQRDICWLENLPKTTGEQLPYLEAKYLRGKIQATILNSGSIVYPGDYVILVDGENSGEKFEIKEKGYIGSTFKKLSIVENINQAYLSLIFLNYKDYYRNNKKGAAIPHLNKDIFADLFIALPPLAEQERIVKRIEELMPLVDEYARLEAKDKALDDNLPTVLKKSILQQAIQGKLVEQDENDEPASLLLERICTEKKAQLGKKYVDSYIYKGGDCYYEKVGSTVKNISDEIPFDIPDTWSWSRLGKLLDIARGGSPRPISEYLTTAEDGINWIKIGDTEKGGKYINSTKEKIKPSGVSKSRMVHKGDFLLTNSMSFGRPYILNIDGCIHDGWLVFSDQFDVFDKEFLYYLLSSQFALTQFTGKVSGAVVKNLNSDKVADSVFPIPPIAEQKRIVEKLNEIFAKL